MKRAVFESHIGACWQNNRARLVSAILANDDAGRIRELKSRDAALLLAPKLPERALPLLMSLAEKHDLTPLAR